MVLRSISFGPFFQMLHFCLKRNEALNYSPDGGKNDYYLSQIRPKNLKIYKSKSPRGQKFSFIFVDFLDVVKFMNFPKSIEIDVQNHCTPGFRDFTIFPTGKNLKKPTHA